MNLTWLIARRDFQAVLVTPTGVLLMALYLCLAGYFFASNLAITQEATLRHTFSSIGILTLFAIPLLTMRLLAEELQSGTFEVLATQPITDWEIILGKFIAGLLAFLVLIAPTVSYLFVLEYFGNPDWKAAVCGFMGLGFMAMTLTALGILFSASTRNQTLAGMAAIGVGLLLSSLSEATYAIGGWFGTTLTYLSFLEHFSLFRRGIFDTRSVAFFVSSTVLLLFLAVQVLESRRWKFGIVPGDIPKTWNYPRLSLALLVLAITLFGEAIVSRMSHGFWGIPQIVYVFIGLILIAVPAWLNWNRLRYELSLRQTGLALVVALNCFLALCVWGVAVYLTSNYYLRYDWTTIQRFAISDMTRNVISEIDQPVDILVTITEPADFVQEIKDLLDEYAAYSPQIRIHHLDPQRSPYEAEHWQSSLQLSSPLSNEIVVVSGERYRRIPRTALTYNVVLGTMEGRRILGPAQFVGEAQLTSTIIQLTRESPGRIVLLSGHGERDPEDEGEMGISHLISALHENHWTVQNHIIMPGANTQLPEDTAVVIAAGPDRALSPQDLAAIRNVLDRGGGFMLLLDPGVDSTGLEALIHAWNIRIGNDLVVDFQSYVAGGDPAYLYVDRFSKTHPIGSGMGRNAAVLSTARRIGMGNSENNPRLSIASFMHTSGDSWAVAYREGGQASLDPKRDRKGPISLGVAVERYEEHPEPGREPMQGRMVVIGDSDFITNRYINLAGNIDLVVNSVEWLAGRHGLIGIRPKTADIRSVTLTSQQIKAVYWWSVFILPGLIVAASLLFLLRRRYAS